MQSWIKTELLMNLDTEIEYYKGIWNIKKKQTFGKFIHQFQLKIKTLT